MQSSGYSNAEISRIAPVFDVVIIEDSMLLREMLVDVLSSVDDVSVVGEAEDQSGGLHSMEAHRPHLVIIDLELKTGSGIGVLTALSHDRERYGNPKTVIFTNHGSSVLRRRCEDLGVDGFFDKSYQLDELIDFIQNERDIVNH